MPRVARVVIPGYPHHLTQRGNNRQPVFLHDDDRRRYLEFLKKHSARHGLTILGYCLMSNHVHLIAIPHKADSLAKAVGRAHFDYTLAFNRSTRRSGHLWQNRFYSCLVAGPHLWNALRYVERNPVRAGMVRRAWEYEWSSAAAHLGRPDASGLLDLDGWKKLPHDRDWRARLAEAEDREVLEAIRTHTHTGRPLAEKSLLRRLEEKLGKRLHALAVGRPKEEG
jgi:putative transposase